MIPYITYREPDSEGRLCYYILQKKFPHFVGILSTGPLENSLASAPVPSYNLWINFKGTLIGNTIPDYKNILQEITDEFARMADWFFEHRIKNEPKKYLKFKIIK